MTKHETIRAILKECPSLGDGDHDEELMDKLRQKTGKTYARPLDDARWARKTLAVLMCINECRKRLPGTIRAEIDRRTPSALKDADNGNRSRLEALRDEVVAKRALLKTVLFALALALAMPIGAQTLDYATLCGATEGTGDNNDFCTLWAQRNYQGMRNALTISIRTARAAENRNRFYFDHKQGAERGAFIQLKRPWMGDDWKVVRQEWHPSPFRGTSGLSEINFAVFNIDRGLEVEVVLSESLTIHTEAGLDADAEGRMPNPAFAGSIYQDGYAVEVGYDFLAIGRAYSLRGNFPSDFVRRIVECKLDEYGWEIGEVEVRPDCEG